MSIKKALVSMRKNGSSHSARLFSDRKWLIPFFASLLVFLTLFSSDTFGVFTSSYGGEQVPLDIVSYSRPEDSRGYFVESDLKKWFDRSSYSGSEPPRFAYLISGTKGDSQRMMRTLQAVYHPRNQYILHLDLEAPPRERLMLGGYVKNDPTFQEVGNVRVMAQSNLVTYKGPTMFACTLQAIAIMLRESLEWDWFINLSASDYPLVTQDDLLHVFSNLSRNLNFIEHTQLTGWKLNSRAKPIIVDPGLYLSKKSDLYLTTQRRSLPTSFKLFTGFKRSFMLHYVVVQSVTASRRECSRFSMDNADSIISRILYNGMGEPSTNYPDTFDKMVKSNAPFARKFARDDPVLDKIDKEILNRTGRFAPGAWCVGGSDNGSDPCFMRGNYSVFRPGPGAQKLQELLQTLLSEDFRKKQCS
ncbi:hypothetical protein OIU78_026827 [Salix suchowensis]|nr:hypothetical protein OIU78_026827 [Salix suchowensis]